jgi:hypothetical protein
MRYLLPALLLLAACQTGPQPGDVYEHKLTRERIQIDRVGVGHDLMQSYREDEARRLEALTFDGEVSDVYYLTGEVVVPSYVGDEDIQFDPQTLELVRPDTTARSVAYLERRSNYVTEQMRSDLFDRFLMDDIPYSVARILPVEDLERDYTRID